MPSRHRYRHARLRRAVSGARPGNASRMPLNCPHPICQKASWTCGVAGERRGRWPEWRSRRPDAASCRAPAIPTPLAPPAAERPWTPPADVAAAPADPAAATDVAPEPGVVYDLPALIDLAQRTNPATRRAWEQARAAAARLGIAESAWLPVLARARRGRHVARRGSDRGRAGLHRRARRRRRCSRSSGRCSTSAAAPPTRIARPRSCWRRTSSSTARIRT